ncbi:hypothetical protein EIMP300_35350 [Escherichia coli]|uniref:Uncharacterized protein n=1 Tax=Escherichia coli TaxID=562 RepID=A0A8S0FNV1_ECOLX|nr:hypothetical protein EIMP300_35350 [Escherichia coli]
MYQAQFSHNPLYCVDIIKTYKPDFTPRVAFILGSGLGALAFHFFISRIRSD